MPRPDTSLRHQNVEQLKKNCCFMSAKLCKKTVVRFLFFKKYYFTSY
jgi:hypothetical protein